MSSIAKIGEFLRKNSEENRMYPCTSRHVAAIVTGHRVREVDINIPGEHAEIAVLRKYTRDISVRGHSSTRRSVSTQYEKLSKGPTEEDRYLCGENW